MELENNDLQDGIESSTKAEMERLASATALSSAGKMSPISECTVGETKSDSTTNVSDKEYSTINVVSTEMKSNVLQKTELEQDSSYNVTKSEDFEVQVTNVLIKSRLSKMLLKKKVVTKLSGLPDKADESSAKKDPGRRNNA